MKTGGSSAWWRRTTWAAPSIPWPAPDRSKAACTWAWATRCRRISRRTDGVPDSLLLRDLGILKAKDTPQVDVILIEVPDEVGGYGAKGAGEIGWCRRPERWRARYIPTTESGASACRWRCAGRGAVGSEIASQGRCRTMCGKQRTPDKASVLQTEDGRACDCQSCE